MDRLRRVDDDWNTPEVEDSEALCRHCHKQLHFDDARIRYYCDPACARLYYLSLGRGEGPPCETCGAPVNARSFRETKFCSSACYGKSIAKHPRLGHRRICEMCDGIFYARYATAPQRFCTRKCADRNKWLNPFIDADRPPNREERRAAARAGRSCKDCGKPINATRHDMHYCGNECRQSAYRKRRRAKKLQQTSNFKCEPTAPVLPGGIPYGENK